MRPASSIHPSYRFGHNSNALSATNSHCRSGDPLNWEMLAIWVFVVFSFAALVFAVQNSHIVSEFLYGPLHDRIHRFHVVPADAAERETRLQKGLREHLLCKRRRGHRVSRGNRIRQSGLSHFQTLSTLSALADERIEAGLLQGGCSGAA